MNRKLQIGAALIAGTLLFSGCASKPEEIRATKVSPLKYDKYNCGQIIDEMNYVSKSTEELYQSLKKRHDSDAAMMGIGLVLFWPTLFLIDGDNDVENMQFADLKGEYKALRHVSVQKQCSVAQYPKSPEEIMKDYREKAEEEQKNNKKDPEDLLKS